MMAFMAVWLTGIYTLEQASASLAVYKGAAFGSLLMFFSGLAQLVAVKLSTP